MSTGSTQGRRSATREQAAARLADLTERVEGRDRARIVAWFRLTGNTPDPTYRTPRAARAARNGPRTHREHLVPVRVFADRLLAGTLTPVQAQTNIRIVTALSTENALDIAKMNQRGGRSPIYKALLECPPSRLVEIAAWRYLSRGVRLVGVGGVESTGLEELEHTQALVDRYARAYDRRHLA